MYLQVSILLIGFAFLSKPALSEDKKDTDTATQNSVAPQKVSKKKNAKPPTASPEVSPKQKPKAKSAGPSLFDDENQVKAGKGKGVRAMFMAAQKLYKQEHYQEALAAYDAILKKYPGHEPTIIQYAKTLYRLDRIKDAYAMFFRVNPLHLDEETSYEYGFSFYLNKRWDGCLYGFKRVPPGHSLADLANFYGAICAAKLRNYQEAEDMLEKAVILPDKLAKSRALYLKHVQALRLLQEKHNLAKDRKQEQQTLAKQEQDAAAKKKGTKPQQPQPPPPPKEEKPKEYVHSGFCNTSQAASISYEQRQKGYYYSGTREEHIKVVNPKFSFSAGPPVLPLPFGLDKRKAVIGVQLDLIATDEITEGEETYTIIEDNKQEREEYISNKIERTHGSAGGKVGGKAGKMVLDPFFEFPIPYNWWMALKGELYLKYPDFERKNRSGYKQGGIGWGGPILGLTPTFDIYYNQWMDRNSKPTFSTMGYNATTSIPITEGLSSNLNFTREEYSYFPGYDLPHADNIFTAGLSQKLPLGFSIGLKGMYDYQEEYWHHGLPSYGDMRADVQGITGKISLTAAPFSFISSTIYYARTQMSYKVENPDAQDAFEKAEPSYIDEFTWNASLNLKF